MSNVTTLFYTVTALTRHLQRCHSQMTVITTLQKSNTLGRTAALRSLALSGRLVCKAVEAAVASKLGISPPHECWYIGIEEGWWEGDKSCMSPCLLPSERSGRGGGRHKALVTTAGIHVARRREADILVYSLMVHQSCNKPADALKCLVRRTTAIIWSWILEPNNRLCRVTNVRVYCCYWFLCYWCLLWIFGWTSETFDDTVRLQENMLTFFTSKQLINGR